MVKILLIFIFLTVFCQTAWTAEIIFKQTAVVSGADIRLGDVADFDEESELTTALASQTVGPAPPPGESIVLRSQTVKHSLTSANSVPEDITWSGSPTITVNRQGITVGPDKILEIIAAYIDEQKKNLPEAEVKFIPASLPLPFILPTGDLASEVIPSNPGILGSSRFSLIFRVDNQVAKNMSIRGRIEATANIVVTAQAVKKDTILSPQLLTMAVTDISEMTGPQFEANDLVGKKLIRSLKAGAPVLTHMVESLPVVRRGEKVKIVINSGQLHVSATGFAFNDGRLDEMIRVQNLSSNKLIYGRVAAPGLVEVML